MTRLQQLAIKIDDIYQAHKAEIDALSRSGPKGGTNAAYISGWVAPGITAISRAANMSKHMPTLNYWSGSNPTPSTAIPLCAFKDMSLAYNKIFNR